MMPSSQKSVSGGVKSILRLEGLFVLASSCLAYRYNQFSWGQFFLFFFLPDVSFLGYFISSKIGAAFYNTAHSYILPLILGSVSYALDITSCVPFILIWIAHIGFDRALGFGLKYATRFSDTHLGNISWNKFSIK